MKSKKRETSEPHQRPISSSGGIIPFELHGRHRGRVCRESTKPIPRQHTAASRSFNSTSKATSERRVRAWDTNETDTSEVNKKTKTWKSFGFTHVVSSNVFEALSAFRKAGGAFYSKHNR
ncbi:unnamed protein product [Acanthoscelides obtectus]|uniref:Uncharacterized protein n=1 Tax=Acanthoscelides obtectus TaxID=200917 RepID=A0A9P0KAU5_ACAOB|nr:unnamed protein product [Acanthoscelides obtectus]CAK1677199.1 hypothetical protein AOBTE_LOCUS31179 [Acanthoscelides obtectus]